MQLATTRMASLGRRPRKGAFTFLARRSSLTAIYGRFRAAVLGPCFSIGSPSSHDSPRAPVPPAALGGGRSRARRQEKKASPTQPVLSALVVEARSTRLYSATTPAGLPAGERVLLAKTVKQEHAFSLRRRTPEASGGGGEGCRGCGVSSLSRLVHQAGRAAGVSAIQPAPSLAARASPTTPHRSCRHPSHTRRRRRRRASCHRSSQAGRWL